MKNLAISNIFGVTFGVTTTRPTKLLYCNGFVANFIYFSAVYSLIGLSFRHHVEKRSQPNHTESKNGRKMTTGRHERNLPGVRHLGVLQAE